MIEPRSRALDRWLGRPLCALLTAWRRLAEPWPRRRANRPSAPQKLAFVKLSEMGAILLAVPAFEAARSRVGADRLYCIVLAGNAEVHELVGIFPPGHVLAIRDDSLWTFALDTLRVMRRCRREGIDTVIDLDGFFRVSALLSYLTGARQRVGLHRYTAEGPYRGDLFTHRVLHNHYAHTSTQFLTLVEALDADRADLPLLKSAVEPKEARLPRFEPTAAELEGARALLARAGGGEPRGPLVILNCNLIDAMPLRRWPRESWLRLGRRILAESPGSRLLLTGLPAERPLSTALAREMGAERVASVAGETATLRSLVTLIGRADAFVSSDCGPAHMAALADTPIVSIFGPETPQLYAPLSPRNESLWAGLACSPCVVAFNHRRSPCRDNRCMQRVSVEQVYAALRRACPALAAPGA